MIVLVDTSVWIDLFRGRRDGDLESLPPATVHAHDFIVGELVLGAIPRGHAALADLAAVPRLPLMSHGEVVEFVRRHRLEGSGVGWIDAHLLASAESGAASLLTNDGALKRAARRAGVRVVR